MSYLEQLAAVMRKHTPVPERESSENSLKHNVIQLAEANIRRRRVRRGVAISCAAVCAVAGGFAALHNTRVLFGERPIEYQVAGQSRVAPIGQYVAPTAKQPVALQFSEGSVVELNPGARARVAKTTVHGATVLLETGAAKVDVVHRPATDWTILAGPYTVHVKGTAFQLDYESASQRFELSMRSGVVNIEGPGLSHPVEVKADERFVHYVGEPKFEHGNAADAHENTKAEIPPPIESRLSPSLADAHQPELDSPATRHISASGSPGAAAGRRGWAAEVARGEYASVLRQAHEKGWSQVLEQSSQSDLMAVANAARFLGRAIASREAFEAIRHRFKGSPAAHAATYLLGRLTEPLSPREAIGWYTQYEREAPGGSLVAEAAGRRLLLVQSLGDKASAERLAREYVARFPDGPYAGVARKIALP